MTDVISPKDADFDIKAFLKNLTTKPGIYCMFDAKDTVIYVGKAKNLKKRVSSYFNKNHEDEKTIRMVSQILRIEITVTPTESEAFLLENNLIKQYKPRYNVLFKDDKSYPYLFLSADPYPRLAYHRGPRKEKGHYFGPFPSAKAVRDSLNFLHKVFKIRSCDNTFFSNRSRPCLQYQIKRCTAPCVRLVSDQNYEAQVQLVKLFLEGKNQAVLDELGDRMQQASEQQDYELAAIYRDQISSLQKIQQQRTVSPGTGDVDVVALAAAKDLACVSVLFIRNGVMLGSKAYFLKSVLANSQQQLLETFIMQYYLNNGSQRILPKQIYCTMDFEGKAGLQQAISEHGKKNIELLSSAKGQRRSWLDMAQVNAQTALDSRLSHKQHYLQRFEDLQDKLKLDSLPERLECFDISHSSGEATVASCVVFNRSGPSKQDYRKFNIKKIKAGDDYAAMEQALSRRFTDKGNRENLPDVLIVDGGKGQLNIAKKIIAELQVEGVLLFGISKGPARKPGEEKILAITEGYEISLDSHTKAFHLLQEIRDEAHRFAIGSHRNKRDKKRKQSLLETIDGVGPNRRQTLLKRFGGLNEIKQASIEELAKVPGISIALAKRIYEALHKL